MSEYLQGGVMSVRKVLLVLLLLLSTTCPGRSQAFVQGSVGGGFMDRIPRPRLLSPDGEVVDLSGKDEILFKWSPHEGKPIGRDYYDFRIYKGYEMLESALFVKKKIPPREHSVAVGTDMFRSGEVYTWSLRQVYRARGRSDRSFSSFRVIRSGEARGKK